MRCLTALLAIALAGPAVAADHQAKPACANGALQPVGGKPGTLLHRLGEEPPARRVYTVVRTEDGCQRPVLVNDRVIGRLPRR